MPLGEDQVMFGCMTNNFNLMPHEGGLTGEYYTLSRSGTKVEVTFRTLVEMKECKALLDKVIRDVEKRAGLKDTHRKRV
jgi:hypothetical protein